MAHLASARGTYLVIAESLRKKIEEGAFPAGSLPSEAALGAAYQVSRNTIRRALKSLENQGVVEPTPGVGWRVPEDGDQRALVERLIDLIAEESLAIGERYPSEAKLCERFGSSRTAVRRALAQMEGRGLLHAVHGKGRTVRALPTSPGQS
ncbi:GntR family transcriptional regulator [Streptomyces hydrogenans]